MSRPHDDLSRIHPDEANPPDEPRMAAEQTGGNAGRHD